MTAPLVLIADNDRAVSSLLVEVLARRGLRTVCAYDGEAADRLAREPGVAALVCDLDMPRRHGLDVLEALDEDGPKLPTVVVSGYLDASLEARLDRLGGVRAVLRKPFDLQRFAELVDGLARGGRRDVEAGAEQ